MLAASLVTGLVAHGKHGTLEESCPAGVCPERFQSDIDRGKSLALVSTVTMFSGLAAGVAGAALLVLDRPSQEHAGKHKRMALVPASGGLVGASLRVTF